MSISAAPAPIASRASATLASVVSVPEGKPTTAMGRMPLPSRSWAQNATLCEATQTVANP